VYEGSDALGALLGQIHGNQRMQMLGIQYQVRNMNKPQVLEQKHDHNENGKLTGMLWIGMTQILRRARWKI
jgi:hypothetical protein